MNYSTKILYLIITLSSACACMQQTKKQNIENKNRNCQSKILPFDIFNEIQRYYYGDDGKDEKKLQKRLLEKNFLTRDPQGLGEYIENEYPEKLHTSINWNPTHFIPTAFYKPAYFPQIQLYTKQKHQNTDGISFRFCNEKTDEHHTIAFQEGDDNILFDGPNQDNSMVIAHNALNTGLSRQSSLYFMKVNNKPGATYHEKFPYRIIVNPKETITALALSSSQRIAQCVDTLNSTTLQIFELNSHLKSNLIVQNVCKSFSKIAFITDTLLVGIVPFGGFFSISIEKNSINYYEQHLSKKDNLSFVDFAVDPVHPHQMVFMYRNKNYEQFLGYIDFKYQNTDKKFAYIPLNISPDHYSTHNQVWFYDNRLALLSNRKIRFYSISCIAKSIIKNKLCNP